MSKGGVTLWQYNYSTELYHYGIKGMKWGVRRYQNEDGTLTEAGRKRISKQYKKQSVKVTKRLKKIYNNMYVKSYNKAADYMNSGGINKFNEAQRKKYGESYAERDGYVQDYSKLFDKVLTLNMNKSLNEFYQRDKNFQKSKALVDKYNMTSWNELARSNEATIEELRRAVEKSI